jgi:alpha-ketoglutarate-dependent taurine dioxygenase
MAETTALGPHLGVEVTGVTDLFADDTLVPRIMEALKWRGVILIRGLALDDEAQLRFSRQLGEVVRSRAGEVFPVSLDPAVNRAADYLKGTFLWHMDGTTEGTPIKATMLTARHVAMVGGGTEFASTYAAWENLPESERKKYQDLRVVHSMAASQRLAHPNHTEAELAAWQAMPSQEMSLVWKRRDGRSSLVIGASADYIVGMSPDESRAVLDELLAWSTQNRFCYSHEWQIGDVVIWDNTGMLHRALPYSAQSERLMHRTTIVGEEAFT